MKIFKQKFTFSTSHFMVKLRKLFKNVHIFDILNFLGSFLVSLKIPNATLFYSYFYTKNNKATRCGIKMHFLINVERNGK